MSLHERDHIRDLCFENMFPNVDNDMNTKINV